MIWKAYWFTDSLYQYWYTVSILYQCIHLLANKCMSCAASAQFGHICMFFHRMSSDPSHFISSTLLHHFAPLHCFFLFSGLSNPSIVQVAMKWKPNTHDDSQATLKARKKNKLSKNAGFKGMLNEVSSYNMLLHGLSKHVARMALHARQLITICGIFDRCKIWH